MNERNYYSRLPDNYHQKAVFDIKNDKKLAFYLNVAALLALLPFASLYYIAFMPKEGVSFELSVWGFAALAGGIIAFIFCHELIHALFFKLFAPASKVRFGFNGAFACAGNPDGYYSKDAYYLIGLAPLIFIDLGLIIALLCVKNAAAFAVLYLLLALHTSGCIGDIYVVARLAAMPRHTVIHDTGMVMTAFVRKLRN